MEKDKKHSELRWISRTAGAKKLYIAVLVLIEGILGISGVIYALMMRRMIDKAVNADKNGFFLSAVLFVGLVVLQILVRALKRFFTEYCRANMENCFKKRLFSVLMNKAYGPVTEVHSGEWMNRLTSDTVVVADGLTDIVPGLTGMMIRMLGALIAILVLEPRFGIFLIPGGILMLLLTYAFRKVLKRLHKRIQEADGSLRVFFQNSLEGLIMIRTFAREKAVETEAEQKMQLHKAVRMKRNHFSNLCNIGFGTAMNGVYVFGVVFCGYGILNGTISYGTLVAILQLINQVQNPLANITGYLPKYFSMIASAERLREAEAFPDDTEGIDGAVKRVDEILNFYRTDFQAIGLRNADFTYYSRGENGLTESVILENADLKIEKGDCVAFTGPSGSGKSTILKIFMCLYPLTSGECYLETGDVTISGEVESGNHNKKNSEEILSSAWRGLYAYVPQGNYLMSGTIREIISFSKETGEQADEKIYHALEIACADSFVKELENGLDTELGERGLGLSEGQIQRLAIARALYSERPILMLDECTSSLDEETERTLLRNLQTMTEKTILIVTHRPKVLDICNRRVEVGDNQIREM